jgi:hypothetical protein
MCLIILIIGIILFQDMLHCEVPTFAGALASLIIEADEDETRACLDLLDLPSTHVQQSTLADDISTRVSRHLLLKLLCFT